MDSVHKEDSSNEKPCTTDNTDAKHSMNKGNLYEAVRKQMEFYFSDANIAKDKFLKNQLKKDPDGYIEIGVFLTFNKISALTNNNDDILMALVSSDLLEISEDKRFVRRKTDVVLKKNVDECTIYVENIPPNADHDWLRDVFMQFGKVVYISLPRFRLTRKPKGFAFIEFENEMDAKQTCEYFDADDNTSRRTSSERYEDSLEPNTRIVTFDVEPMRKRQRLDESLCDNMPKTDTDLTKACLNKNRRCKKKNEERPEIELMNLRVISKIEWKRLRNIYLEMQKANIVAVKKCLGLSDDLTSPRADTPLQFQCDNEAHEGSQNENKKSELHFISGVIIRFETSEPVSDAKHLMNELKTLEGVRFVDLKDDENIGYVRCSEAEITKKVLKDLQERFSANILLDDDEKNYWNDIFASREKKLSGKSRNKTSGRAKVISRAVRLVQKNNINTHIRFDD